MSEKKGQPLTTIPPEAEKCPSCKKVLDPHNGNCRC